MKPTLHSGGDAFRRLAGWGALLLYVAAFSPLGVGLVTALGAMDRDHRVNLQATESGLRVVLHHEQRCQAHHHGALARTLTLFAQPVNPAQPDHVLQFSAVDNVASTKQIKAAPVAGSDSSPTVPPAWIVCRWSQPPTTAIPGCAPPGQPASRHCLRSTVLLI